MCTIAIRLMIMLLSVVFVFGSTQADEDLVLKKKFFPGHYLTTTQMGQEGMPPIGSTTDKNNRQLVSSNPNFRGYNNRYSWNHLEPSRGVYNFDKILKDLATAAADGKVGGINIGTKRLRETDPWPLPNYMNPDSPQYDSTYSDLFYHYDREGFTGEVFPKTYKPLYADRLIDLITALGAALDSHPALSYVGFEETGQGGIREQPDFSVDGAISYFRRIHDAAASAFPTTIIKQLVNYQGGLSETDWDVLMNRMLNVNTIAIGAPDIRLSPTSHPLVHRFGKYFTGYRGIIPIITECQSPSYKYSTARGQLDFAVKDLNAHIIAWVPQKLATNEFRIYDVIEVVNAEQGRTASGIPSSLILKKEPSQISAPTNLKVDMD